MVNRSWPACLMALCAGTLSANEIQVEIQQVAGGGGVMIRKITTNEERQQTPPPLSTPATQDVDLSSLKFDALTIALEQAARDGRQVLLITEAPWDPWSKKMSETIYNDPRFDEMLGRKYITVRLTIGQTRGDKDMQPIVDALAIKTLPQSIVFNSEGELVKRLGFINGNLDRYISSLGENGETSDAMTISQFQRYSNRTVELDTDVRKPATPPDKNLLKEIRERQQNQNGMMKVNLGVQKIVKKEAPKEPVKKEAQKAPPQPVPQPLDKKAQQELAEQLKQALQAQIPQQNIPPMQQAQIEQLFEELLEKAMTKEELEARRKAEEKAKAEEASPKIRLVKPQQKAETPDESPKEK